MIEISNATYSYPGTAEPALRSIRLSIPEGQFCAVVGANGAGKSTLCYMITGFVPHFFGGTIEGVVHSAGMDVLKTPPAELAGRVGLVFDNPFNQISGARFTVRDEIAFGPENLGIPRDEIANRIERILVLTGLADLADRSPYSLSGGQQQRLAIASILVMQPSVLVLDEPTSQLDPAGTRQVFEALATFTREASITVVVVEHKLHWLATFADRVIALAEGRVVADGDPEEILASSATAELGIGQTKFTQAARVARARGLVPKERALPVTLEQAVTYFG